jgi:hypothetical protein
MRALILMLLLSGCGGLVAPPDERPPVPRTSPQQDGGAEDGDDSSGTPGGNLPIGYNERQCQWDACGGPLPVDHNTLVEDPVSNSP